MSLRVRNLTKELQRPAPAFKDDEEVKTENEVLFQLNYIHANAQKFKLVRFPSTNDLDEIIHLAKKFCARNNLRFVFIEPAITIIEAEDECEV